MEFYNAGISNNIHVTTDSDKFVPLGLNSTEMNALIDFMNSLTDENFDKTIPSSVPSGLNPGGNIF